MNKRERIVKFLLEKGCIEVVCRSKKYRQFLRPGRSDYYFVGRNGALRAGKNISESISLTYTSIVKNI